MKKITIAIITMLIIGATQAEYTLKIPLEESRSGSLPNGSIRFTNQNQGPTVPTENWVATTPLYTDWVNDGEPFNCTNWSPDPSTAALGETFTQTATDCEQNQTRSRQDREQETTTLATRNNGSVIVENQTLTNQSNTRTATGTKPIPDCRYKAFTPAYFWQSYADYENIGWDYNDVGQNIIIPKNDTTFSTGGWIYTRGQLKFYGDEYNSYEVCRVPS